MPGVRRTERAGMVTTATNIGCNKELTRGTIWKEDVTFISGRKGELVELYGVNCGRKFNLTYTSQYHYCWLCEDCACKLGYLW